MKDMLNKIILGDCLDVMKDIADKSIDMILCDLPYGLTGNKLDVVIPFEPLWEQYSRIIKDNGAIVLFGQGLFYIDLVNSNRRIFRYDLVWNKVLTSGFLNAKRMPLRQHEQIAVFYKQLPTYNPQFTKGNPLHSKGKSYINKEYINQNYGEFHMTDDSRCGSTEKYPTSILTFNKPHPSIAKHRTEKSIECLEWLVKTYTNEDEVVLDCCIGSGTTAIAAIRTGRQFIGIEKDPEYHRLACERVEKENNDLFNTLQ